MRLTRADSTMLKTVPVVQLRLGMFVHDLGLSWWEHNFLRQRFPIDSDEILQKIRATRVASIVIDTDHGLDVAAADESPAPARVASKPGMPVVNLRGSSEPVALADATAPRKEVPRTSLQQEMQVARKLVREARSAVKSAMADARTGRISSVPAIRGLADGMVESAGRNPGALLSLAGLKTKDDYTFMHCVAVGTFMIALGKQMGLGEEELREAGTAGLLHDVGKSLIPDAVLNKPGKLTDDEFKLMRAHPQAGYDMLREAGYEDSAALEVVLHHHERLDGKGYPHGLSGEKVTRLARMGAVVDVYDAVTSDRVYHRAIPPTAALKMLLSQSGAHFDEPIVRAFLATVGIYPNGSLVKLQSGKLAVVVEQTPDKPLAPLVRVFYSLKSQMPISLSDLDLSAGSDSIVGYENPIRWGFDLSRITELKL